MYELICRMPRVVVSVVSDCEGALRLTSRVVVSVVSDCEGALRLTSRTTMPYALRW